MKNQKFSFFPNFPLSCHISLHIFGLVLHTVSPSPVLPHLDYYPEQSQLVCHCLASPWKASSSKEEDRFSPSSIYTRNESTVKKQKCNQSPFHLTPMRLLRGSCSLTIKDEKKKVKARFTSSSRNFNLMWRLLPTTKQSHHPQLSSKRQVRWPEEYRAELIITTVFLQCTSKS